MATKTELQLHEKIVRAKRRLEQAKTPEGQLDDHGFESQKNDFGHALRTARRRFKITQQELAEALGISRSYLSLLESQPGKQPSLDLLAKIYIFFEQKGLTVSELIDLLLYSLRLQPLRLLDSNRLDLNRLIEELLVDLSLDDL